MAKEYADIPPALMLAGFWPRLMGYISAAREPNAERVRELAAERPTGFTLTKSQAAALLAAGMDARIAAKSWFTHAPNFEAEIPEIPGEEYPNITGGEPGEFNHQVILRPAGSRGLGRDVPMKWSDDEPTEVREVVELMNLWLANNPPNKQSPGVAEAIEAIRNDYDLGSKTKIIPDYIYKRIISGE